MDDKEKDISSLALLASLSTTKQTLEEKDKEVLQAIIKADNKKELQNQFDLFNINQSKKNALRIAKLQGLRANVEDEIIDRFNKRPDQVSNRELLDYLQITSNEIDKSQKVMDSVHESDLINNPGRSAIGPTTEVTVNIGTDLSRDNKEKTVSAIKDILSILQVKKNNNGIVPPLPPEPESLYSDVEVQDAIVVETDDSDNS